MAIADILKRINDAEAEADNIVAHARAKTAEIEKDTAVKIDKINTECDAEIAAKIKNMTPPAAVHGTGTKVTVPKEKINAAVDFGTKEFFASVGMTAGVGTHFAAEPVSGAHTRGSV
jgi:hypothetical protein